MRVDTEGGTFTAIGVTAARLMEAGDLLVDVQRNDWLAAVAQYVLSDKWMAKHIQ